MDHHAWAKCELLLLGHVGVAALRRLLRQRLLLELVPLLRHVRVLRQR